MEYNFKAKLNRELNSESALIDLDHVLSGQYFNIYEHLQFEEQFKRILDSVCSRADLSQNFELKLMTDPLLERFNYTQPYCLKAKMRKVSSNSFPDILYHEGDYFIIDGHHRILKAIHNQTPITVKIWKY